MMAYEDYSFWSRYLPLGNWMTRKLCRIIEKKISPEIYCRNVQFEIKLQHITHTWCSMVFARSLNKAIRKRKALLSMGFGKMSIKFHVPSLPKWFLFMFRNIGRSIRDQICFHFLSSKHFFSKNSSFTKFQPSFFLLLNSF